MTRATDFQRAHWAAVALDAYREQVGTDDPRTLILDLVADLGHLASSRRIDFTALAARAISIWAYECKHLDGLGASPQVTLAIAGHRPKYAWRKRSGGGR